MSNLNTIQTIEENGLTWVNVNHIGLEEMKYLEEKYHFSSVNLADCYSPLQRPKLDVRADYFFMVLLFPLSRRKTREIIPAEVDFFVGKNFIITIHNNEVSSLINFFNLCQINISQRQKYFQGNPSTLLHQILNRLCLYCHPILDDLQLSTASIEEHIFRGYEKRMVREILIIKRNLINFRQIIRVHQNLISQLTNKVEKIMPLGELRPHFLELAETASDIWGLLENLYQNVNALEQTNNSLISFRLSDIMRILTIISVIVLPISIVANLVNIILNLKYDAATAIAPIAIIVGLCVSMFLYFKKKQWL